MDTNRREFIKKTGKMINDDAMKLWSRPYEKGWEPTL